MAKITTYTIFIISNNYTPEIQSLIKLINIKGKSGKKWEILEIII